jgi:hypothetical protein
MALEHKHTHIHAIRGMLGDLLVRAALSNANKYLLRACFADSCRDHIEQLYGENSREIARFEALQSSVREDSGWVMLDQLDDDFLASDSVTVSDFLLTSPPPHSRSGTGIGVACEFTASVARLCACTIVY